MVDRVIQGFFMGGRPRLLTPPTQSKPAVPRVGAPAPAFTARAPVAQRQGGSNSFQVDPGRVGLTRGGPSLA
jgi:hypothetical protein